jgi:hypothetical protein
MSIEERVLHLEKSFTLLVELARSSNERLESHDRDFSNLDAKIAALADAQIRTEESLNRLEALIERHIREGHK